MIPWFKHECSLYESEKVMQLRINEGIEGYGCYVVLLEKLTQNDGVLRSNYNALGYNLRLDVGLIKRVVEDYDLFCRFPDEEGVTCFADDNLRHACELTKQKQESRRQAGLASAASRAAKKTAVLDNSGAMPNIENQQMLTQTATNVEQMLTKSATDKIREEKNIYTTTCASENFEKIITAMALDIDYQQSVIEHLSRHGHKDKTTADVKMLLLRFSDNVRTNKEPLGNKNEADIRKWFRFWSVQELDAVGRTPKPRKDTKAEALEAERQANKRKAQAEADARRKAEEQEKQVASPDDAQFKFKKGKI